MKREPFLSALRSGHHSALVVGMVIQQCFDKIQCDAAEEVFRGLPEMVAVFFHSELKPHFASEESIIQVFRDRLDKKHSQRIYSDHRYLISLIQDGSLEALNEFAVFLAAHIQFEEEEFYPTLEKILQPGEKQAVALYFEKTLPSFSEIEREKEPKPG